jgi:folate-binding protein YgfZ
MAFKSPLHGLHKNAGAQFQEVHGWKVAEHYGSPLKEYEAIRFSAGLVDLSCVGLVCALGRDRSQYIHRMVSNDIQKLKTGEGCYATLLNHQGRMESDLYAYSLDNELWLECPAAANERVYSNLAKYLVAQDVRLEDRSAQMGVLSLQGPQACALMGKYLGLSLDHLNHLQHQSIPPGRDKIVVRRDRSGCDGFDLWLPFQQMEETWSRLTQSEGIQPVGREALNWLRTEAGIPLFGIDMDNRYIPLEFGLNSAISLNKGCYRGQEIIARVTYRGRLKRELGGIRSNSPLPMSHGTEIHGQGNKIGLITSATHSPRLNALLALALLKTEYLNPGTPVEVISEKGPIPAEVIRLPLGGN